MKKQKFFVTSWIVSGRKRLLFFVLLVCCGVGSPLPAFSQAPRPIELGVPPTFSDGLLVAPRPDSPLAERTFLRGLNVDTQNMQASRDLYYSHYVGSEGVSPNWTGNHDTCAAGTTSQQYKDARLLELNYFRAMAGVPADVTFLSDYSAKTQKAALMMSVNKALSHTPPTSWTCYTTDGAEAAGKSNLALGYASHIIGMYMKDPGDNNSAVGHRRWILYPQTQVMGTGDVSASEAYSPANALWVFDSHTWDPRPATREEFVAWPPPGYVPYQVVYPRWSFAYDDADLTNASVSMTRAGSAMALSQEPLRNGYGENTLVWYPSTMSSWDAWPSEHLITYRVTISQVIIGGTPRNFTYDVHVFDPAQPICEAGDMNCDGSFSIFDLQRLINCIFGSGSCDHGDLDGDGNYNIYDLQQLINKIFS